MITTMMVSLLAGCGSKNESAANGKAAAKEDIITLKVFSNLPDRKNGQGLVEQIIIDEYMEENPHIKIEVEALDEEAYKTKFKAMP